MLEQLGNLGEFIGAIAVVVSLVYLAAQIRQNTRAIRANTFHGIVDSLTDGIAEIARDAELTRIWIEALRQSGELSEVDRARFRLLLLMAVRRWENAFYQSRAGMLEEPQWEGIARDIRSIVLQPGFRSWWSGAPDVVSSDFSDFLRRLMQTSA